MLRQPVSFYRTTLSFADIEVQGVKGFLFSSKCLVEARDNITPAARHINLASCPARAVLRLLPYLAIPVTGHAYCS
jgi:hypothetical protein